MALNDITNLDCSKKKTRKRLSDGSVKSYTYNVYRKQIDLQFESESDKLQFCSKLGEAKMKSGCQNNTEVMKMLVNEYLRKEKCLSEPSARGDRERVDTQITTATVTATQPNEENEPAPDLQLFVGEDCSILKLNEIHNCHHSICTSPLMISDMSRTEHVLKCKLHCKLGHTYIWASSTTLGNEYLVNYRLFLAYVCSGITPIQYERFSNFSKFGILTDHFLRTKIKFISTIVDLLSKTSIRCALNDEIHASDEDGICIMTDARHACRKNSYHTDHVALGRHIHKVVDYQHINKLEDRVTQRHEAIGCSRMYNSFEDNNIKVKEHSHDRNLSINRQIKDKDGVQNLNDRWHVTKPITKGFKKLGSGAQKNIGVTWHPQLCDKGAPLRNHVYWAIENCRADPARLRELIDSAMTHFQNDHSKCVPTSECRTPGYVPSTVIITDPNAVNLLTKYIHGLVVYKNAGEYLPPHIPG